MAAKLMLVIRTGEYRGEGTKEDIGRVVTQYFSIDGELLAENDPCPGGKNLLPVGIDGEPISPGPIANQTT